MDLNEYQKRIEDTWISNPCDTERIVLGICGETGEIAEKFKKYYRGDYENDYENFLKSISKEIGDVQYYLAKLCNEYNLNMQDILEENIKKLSDRQKRGKLKGNGDER